jgi:DNA-binding NarL/FixJ family response regulator
MSAGDAQPQAHRPFGERAGSEALSMGTHSVVLAGRKAPMLRSLKRLLEPEFEVAAMADNVLSLVDALEQIEPDLLVLDTGSPDFAAPDLAHRLQTRHASLRVLLVGSDDEDCSHGAPQMAFVSKHTADQTLLPVARTLLRAKERSGENEGLPME